MPYKNTLPIQYTLSRVLINYNKYLKSSRRCKSSHLERGHSIATNYSLNYANFMGYRGAEREREGGAIQYHNGRYQLHEAALTFYGFSFITDLGHINISCDVDCGICDKACTIRLYYIYDIYMYTI